MSFLSKLTDFVGGGLFKEIKETAMAYFPPDMSPQQKSEAAQKLQELLDKKQARAEEMLKEASDQLDRRIAEQEGTASDLKAMPILGPIMLFLRGAQRPVWGFTTLWMDYQWFFGTFDFTDQQQKALTLINFLVLGFLFGERTMKNLEPMLVKIFAK